MSDDWRKTALVGITSASIGAFSAIYISQIEIGNKDRALDIKMVDVALAILAGERDEKKEVKKEFSRRFAVEILRQNSGLEIKFEDDFWINWANSEETIHKAKFRALQLEIAEIVADMEGTLKKKEKVILDAEKALQNNSNVSDLIDKK